MGTLDMQEGNMVMMEKKIIGGRGGE